MCLIAFAFSPGKERYLMLAANRDEFHQRPTRPMAWWKWPQGPLAGRDEKAGGTWLAVARDGRWAAVTNFRDAVARNGNGARSRGHLPIEFLRGNYSMNEYLANVYRHRHEYGPFNLLVGDRNELWYCSTYAEPRAVEPGVHALSNGLLDEPWPKSRRTATALGGLVNSTSPIDCERLLDLMHDRQPAQDAELPDTGIGLKLERFLSPPFIVGEDYGTRCTTVLVLGTRHQVVERTHGRQGNPVSQLHYRFGTT